MKKKNIELLIHPFKAMSNNTMFGNKIVYGSLTKHYREDKWYLSSNKAIPNQSESYGVEISTSHPVEIDFDTLEETTILDIENIK